MPWIEATGSPGETPARYVVPTILAYQSCLHEEYLDNARKNRAKYSTIMQEIKASQKEAGKRKDYDLARLLSEESKEMLKWQRAYDFVVKYIEGDPNYVCYVPQSAASEIAPYIDLAFNRVVF